VSARLDPSWRVLAGPSWTPVAYFSVQSFATEAEAVGSALRTVGWLASVLDR
jgi:hypothetical protein